MDIGKDYTGKIDFNAYFRKLSEDEKDIFIDFNKGITDLSEKFMVIAEKYRDKQHGSIADNYYKLALNIIKSAKNLN